MNNGTEAPETSRESLDRKLSARSIRLQVTWSRYGDSIERAVVRALPEGKGARIVLQEHEICLAMADIYWRGDSPPVDELFVMLERSFCMAGASPMRRPYARVPVGLVTDQDGRLAGFSFFPDGSRDQEAIDWDPTNVAFLFSEDKQ